MGKFHDLDNNIIYFYLALLGLRCCLGFSLVAERGHSLVAVLLLLWSMGSRAYGLQQLQHTGSVVAAPRL